MNDNPYLAPETLGRSTGWSFAALRRWGIGLAISGGLIAVVIALLIPATRSAPGAARRVQCSINLKQIAIALHNYHDVYNAFPPAYTVDAEGNPLHSWRTLLLPFVDQAPLYNKIDLTKPWNDRANQEAYDTEISIYRCPATNIPKGQTTYLALVGETACFNGTQSRRLGEVTDGHHLTLMVVEVAEKQCVHWMAPTDADEELFVATLADRKLSHGNGVQAACVDSTRRYILRATAPSKLHALMTINGDDDRLADD